MQQSADKGDRNPKNTRKGPSPRRGKSKQQESDVEAEAPANPTTTGKKQFVQKGAGVVPPNASQIPTADNAEPKEQRQTQSEEKGMDPAVQALVAR